MNDLLRYNKNLALLILLFNLVGPAAAIEELKDPTRPLLDLDGQGLQANRVEQSEKKITSLILQGVIIKDGQKIAVINQQLIKIGQSIEGYQVKAIEPYGVQLQGEIEAEQLSLTLLQAKIKVNHE